MPGVEICRAADRAKMRYEESRVGHIARAPDGVPLKHTFLIVSSSGGREKNF